MEKEKSLKNLDNSPSKFSVAKLPFLTLIFFIASVFLFFSWLPNYQSKGSDLRSLFSFQTFKCPSRSDNSYIADMEMNDLDTVLEKASMSSKTNKTVIIAMVNKAYVEAPKGDDPVNMLDLFLESFWLGEGTKPLINNLVIVATDLAAYERCVFRGLRCYLLGNGTDGSDFPEEKVYMSQGFIKMMWRRTLFLLTVLRKGYNFVFTDTDVMWLRDPYTILNIDPTLDIQFSTDLFNGNQRPESNRINTGFYMVRSNPKTIALFERWYVAKDTFVNMKEQDVLQRLIRQGSLKELNVTASYLDTQHFNSFCENNTESSQVVTIHAKCCRYINAKIKDLVLVLRDWQRLRSLPVNESSNFSWSNHVNCIRSWASNNDTN